MPDSKPDIKAVFKEKVNERLALHPNQWSGDDSAAVIRGVIEALQDESGNQVQLDAGDKDIIQVVSRPTSAGQMRVIKRIIEDHNAKCDSDIEDRISKVFSAPAFKLYLIQKGLIKDSAGDDLLG